MSDYTPTTSYVRSVFAGQNEGILDLHRQARFDHWLEQYKQEVIAKELNELADHFSKRRVLWYGDGGIEVCVDEERLTMVKLTDWLRARAQGENK